MNEEQYQESIQTGYYNHGLNNQIDSTFARLRLDTEEILSRIVGFLEGKRIETIYNPDLNRWETKEIQMGKPLVNKQGISELAKTIYLRINHHVVQGNFKEAHYDNYLERTRKEIAEQVVINCYDWGIQDLKLNYIIDNLMGFIEPFISRLINNKERESYTTQFSTRETISDVNKKKGGLRNLSSGLVQ